jgi:predicted permease
MWARVEDLLRDASFAVRTLRRNPSYTVVALITLALGIGANVALFSVINGILLAPLANDRTGRVLVLAQQRQPLGLDHMGFSVRELDHYRREIGSLEAISEHHTMTFNLLGEGEPEEVKTGVVDHQFFDMMGITPVLGRGFTEAEDRGAADAVIVLSHAYWQSRFGGDPKVLGRTLRMNGRVHTVVGVLPPFTPYPSNDDIYVPTSQCPVRSSAGFKNNPNARMMDAFGRMPAGASFAVVQQDLSASAARLAREDPTNYPAHVGHAIVAKPVKEALVSGARPQLLFLLGATLFVLLIACANVASLTLARASQRETEMAVRVALGAGRARLLTQLLTESVVLALAGGALGLLIAWAGHSWLVAYAARFTPRAGDASLDATVLPATLAIALLTGLAFGTLPALRAHRRVFGAIRESTGATAVGRKLRLQRALVVGQLAFTFMLLTGAGLLARSVLRLAQTDVGFVTENVLTMRVVTAIGTYPTIPERDRLWNGILERVRSLPQVVSAAVATIAPLDNQGNFSGLLAVVGQPDGRYRAETRFVSPDFFRTTGIPLVQGRAFDDRDGPDAPPVVIVNRTFARTILSGREPIGAQLLGCDNSGKCDEKQILTVVGIVGDSRQGGIEAEPAAELYAPGRQSFHGQNLLIRTTGDPTRIAKQVVGFVRQVDPDLPVEDIRTLDEIKTGALAPRRLTATLVALFAGVALLVTLAGVVGLTSYSVNQRRQEMAVRMAMGAEARDVLGLVLRESLTLIAAGLALGLIGTIALRGLLRGFVFGIEATDPLTMVAVGGLFLVCAMTGCYVAARRVTTVDPALLLRPA